MLLAERPLHVLQQVVLSSHRLCGSAFKAFKVVSYNEYTFSLPTCHDGATAVLQHRYLLQLQHCHRS
jgi:hypothetical protein